MVDISSPGTIVEVGAGVGAAGGVGVRDGVGSGWE